MKKWYDESLKSLDSDIAWVESRRQMVKNNTFNDIHKIQARGRVKEPLMYYSGIAVVIFILFIGFTHFLPKFDDKTGSESELGKEQVTSKDDPVTILLMGVDDFQKNEKGRTDSLILISLNPKTKEVDTLSIPRDTFIAHLPKVGIQGKINDAYTYDNEQGTVDAVQNLLGIPVDYYIKTGVQGFQRVIDELGGITVNVPYDFKQPDLNNNYVHFYKGDMNLDGSQALAFVRMRYSDPEGELGREKRQLVVIRALAKKAVSLNTITKANSLIRMFGSDVTTNLKLKEIFALRNFIDELKNKDLNSLEIKGQGEVINHILYFVPDQQSINDLKNKLKRILEIK
jgi:polyisoprenyl-teichoic acid--peptidoglycan teichoic acid transferase